MTPRVKATDRAGKATGLEQPLGCRRDQQAQRGVSEAEEAGIPARGPRDGAEVRARHRGGRLRAWLQEDRQARCSSCPEEGGRATEFTPSSKNVRRRRQARSRTCPLANLLRSLPVMEQELRSLTDEFDKSEVCTTLPQHRYLSVASSDWPDSNEAAISDTVGRHPAGRGSSDARPPRSSPGRPMLVNR